MIFVALIQGKVNSICFLPPVSPLSLSVHRLQASLLELLPNIKLPLQFIVMILMEGYVCMHVYTCIHVLVSSIHIKAQPKLQTNP